MKMHMQVGLDFLKNILYSFNMIHITKKNLEQLLAQKLIEDHLLLRHWIYPGYLSTIRKKLIQKINPLLCYNFFINYLSTLQEKINLIYDIKITSQTVHITYT